MISKLDVFTNLELQKRFFFAKFLVLKLKTKPQMERLPVQDHETNPQFLLHERF